MLFAILEGKGEDEEHKWEQEPPPPKMKYFFHKNVPANLQIRKQKKGVFYLNSLIMHFPKFSW